MLTSEQRARLERLADELEGIARTSTYELHTQNMEGVLQNKAPANLYTLAWDIKQIARWRTVSFGV